MKHIYIKLENGIVKVFGSEKELPKQGIYYLQKQNGLSQELSLTKEWSKSLIELKWRGKQDEIKTYLKFRNENNLELTLEQYLKEGYREVTYLVDLEETDCKFPACTCSPSKCKERGFVVKFKESETQDSLFSDIELIIRRENGNNLEMATNIITELKKEFEIKRK